MNKTETVEAIAQSTGVSKSDIEKVINAFFEEAVEAVKGGDKMVIPGWISFESVDRAAREGRNPATGEKLMIPARKAVKVSAGSKLKNAVK